MKTTIEFLQIVKNVIDSHADKLTNNELLTRYSLIDPLLRQLGWDILNPEEVIPGYSINKLFSDYAIFKNKAKQPFIIIEAKCLKKPLIDKTQIGSYIANRTARFAIFTDGAIWKLFDFHIQAKDDPNERIVLEVNILDEPDNIVGLKLFCLSKENLFSDNPFFINHNNISNKFSRIHEEKKVSPPTTNINPERLLVRAGDFDHQQEQIFSLKTNPSVKIDVSKSIRDVELQLRQNGLSTTNVGSFRYSLKTRADFS
jgi:predicted type IV restriction endonuclease